MNHQKLQGSISKRFNQKTGAAPYQATIRGPGLPRSTSRTFPTRAEAECFLATALPEMEALARGPSDDLSTPPPQDIFDAELGTDLINLYVEEKAQPWEANLLAILAPHLGAARLGEMDELWVESLCARLVRTTSNLRRPYSKGTIKQCMCAFKRAWTWRRRHLRLTTQFVFPFYVKAHLGKKINKGRTRRLMDLEEAILMERCAKGQLHNPKHVELLIGLALETGARLQEMILADDWEFNLKKRVWSIPAEHTKMKADRATGLTFKAVDIIEQLRALAEPGSAKLFEVLGTPARFSHRFSRLTRRLGIANLRLHDLRHEAISRMVERHRDLKVEEIMFMVGHETYEMHRRYDHMRIDELVKRMK